MQLNELQRKTPYKQEKRVGRGGARGKTAGRGTKGQKARAGHKIWPNIREIIKKIPKRRGYSQKSIVLNTAVVNVGTLEKTFSAGETITPAILAERHMVRSRLGKTPIVKILADGEITKKLNVVGCMVSASARVKIEKAGGTIA